MFSAMLRYILKEVIMTEFQNVKEVAERLRISEQTVCRLYRSGVLLGHKVGRQIRIPCVAVEAYLARTVTQPKVYCERHSL